MGGGREFVLLMKRKGWKHMLPLRMVPQTCRRKHCGDQPPQVQRLHGETRARAGLQGEFGRTPMSVPLNTDYHSLIALAAALPGDGSPAFIPVQGDVGSCGETLLQGGCGGWVPPLLDGWFAGACAQGQPPEVLWGCGPGRGSYPDNSFVEPPALRCEQPGGALEEGVQTITSASVDERFPPVPPLPFPCSVAAGAVVGFPSACVSAGAVVSGASGVVGAGVGGVCAGAGLVGAVPAAVAGFGLVGAGGGDPFPTGAASSFRAFSLREL